MRYLICEFDRACRRASLATILNNVNGWERKEQRQLSDLISLSHINKHTPAAQGHQCPRQGVCVLHAHQLLLQTAAQYSVGNLIL